MLSKRDKEVLRMMRYDAIQYEESFLDAIRDTYAPAGVHRPGEGFIKEWRISEKWIEKFKKLTAKLLKDY